MNYDWSSAGTGVRLGGGPPLADGDDLPFDGNGLPESVADESQSAEGIDFTSELRAEQQVPPPLAACMDRLIIPQPEAGVAMEIEEGVDVIVLKRDIKISLTALSDLHGMVTHYRSRLEPNPLIAPHASKMEKLSCTIANVGSLFESKAVENRTAGELAIILKDLNRDKKDIFETWRRILAEPSLMPSDEDLMFGTAPKPARRCKRKTQSSSSASASASAAMTS